MRREEIGDRCCQNLLGFSLVELMAVLAVVGTLVALALPRYRLYVARGRQAEAVHNLAHINTLQKSYNLKMQGLGLGDNLYFRGWLGGNGNQYDKCTTRYKKTRSAFACQIVTRCATITLLSDLLPPLHFGRPTIMV